MATAECSTCEEDIDFEEWTAEVVICPNCGAHYEAQADYIDVETSSWMFWLEPIEKKTNG